MSLYENDILLTAAGTSRPARCLGTTVLPQPQDDVLT